MQFERKILEIDNEKIVCETLIRKDNVVILHGAGASDRKRYYGLAREILRRGFGVILFDFSGHGDSTGELKDLSLNRRVIQVRKVIDTLAPKEGSLYLVGFSMSGQTVCDLLPLYKERIPAILLGCPGVYARSVQKMVFGGGEFTSKIRSLDSWKDSAAFDELRSFRGRTVIAIGSDDQVIPKLVIVSLKKVANDLEYVEYSGVDHQLAKWLASHENEQKKLIDLLFE